MTAPQGANPIPSLPQGPPQGQPEATLHILSRDGTVTEHDLTDAETRIGKGPQNDIILADPSVSSTHAQIAFAGGVFTLSDLGSRNGTTVNDAPVTAPRKLQHGDLINMGHCTLTFRLKEAETTLSIARTALLDNAPPPPPAPPIPVTPPLTEESLAQALVASGLVAQAEVNRLRGTGSPGPNKPRLARALIEENLVTEIGLRDLISRTFNMAPVEMQTMEIDALTATRLGADFMRHRLLCPVIGPQPDRLMLAIADPTDKASIEEVERITGRKASLRVAMPSEIRAQVDGHFTPRLIGVMPTGEKVEALLNQPEIEIGKATHNKLILSDPTVSATHAVVLVRDGGYSIVDLGSSNGTFVNGKRLESEAYTLQHGDKLQFGNVLLAFRNPAETSENKTAHLSLEALEEVRRRAASRSNPAAPIPRTDPSSWSAAAPIPQSQITTAAEDADVEKGEKEKKKKKKNDDRIKAAWVGAASRIFAQVLSVLLSVGLAIYVLQRPPSGGKNIKPSVEGGGSKGETANESNPFTPSENWQKIDTGFLKGKLESSGIVYVPGSNGALIASDNLGGEVQWMEFDANGKQVGAIKHIPLGVNFGDAEAITYGSSFYYVLSSQSDPSDPAQHALIRFAFDAETKTMRGHAEVIQNLRSFLLQNVSEISAVGAPSGDKGGLNIEGLAWDRDKERLLLGLRSPLLGNQAALIPLKLRDPRSPFSVDNLKIDTPHVIFLPLEDQGVRDITFDTRLNKFMIISGAPEHGEKTDFVLWSWSGEGDSKPVKLLTLDQRMKPEGITGVNGNGRSFALLVGDVGNYLKLDYSSTK
jgi:pSer/pThr/pTyr-binding forkhead associated (FHA) protein